MDIAAAAIKAGVGLPRGSGTALGRAELNPQQREFAEPVRPELAKSSKIATPTPTATPEATATPTLPMSPTPEATPTPTPEMTPTPK